MTSSDNGGRPHIERRAFSAVRQLGPPPVTVWLGSAMYTFPADRDVTVGRDRNSDIWLRDTDPATFTLISRVHAILRFDGTTWVLVDRSQNGAYVEGTRRSLIPLADGMKVALGSPQGPQLTFRVPSANTVERLHDLPPRNQRPRTRRSRPPGRPVPRECRAGHRFSKGWHPRPRRRRAPFRARAPFTPTGPGRTVRRHHAHAVSPPRPGAAAPGTKTVGRSKTNDIVVEDYLVSRVHALLNTTASGLEIRDNNSSNGTFVNGSSVTRSALREGDVVTVGNTDLLVAGTTLVPRTAPARTSGLAAHGLGLTIDGHQLLTDVSFSARPGTLTAVIGPSGAGKSTLIKLIGGATKPSSGVVSFDGHDVHAEYASMRSRIGMVPQDDVVHRQLTLEHALNYAAELRLPPDTSVEDRRQVVKRVLNELELSNHKKTRVDKLSGGQRKRASVAMELLTGPSLLILDEPTSGLDPALDRQVMTMLRRLADAGRVVLVVTHSLTYVNMCDQVLLLAPGGKTAFADPPAQIGSAMGTPTGPNLRPGQHRRGRSAQGVSGAAPTAASLSRRCRRQRAPLGKPPQTSLWRQVYTLVRRQSRLITADRGYFVFLAALPFVLGVLSLAVPGNTGLGLANPQEPEEPIDIMILLNIGVVFMGTALTVRDLVGERLIFHREQAVGLSGSAYLMSKIVVYSIAALIPTTAILTTIMVVGKGAPAARRSAPGQKHSGGHHRVVPDAGDHGDRLGGGGVGVVIAGAVHRAGAADAGGGDHGRNGVGRWAHSGDRAPGCSTRIVAAAGAVGLRGGGLDRSICATSKPGLPADKLWEQTRRTTGCSTSGCCWCLASVFTALVRYRLRLRVHSHGR